MSARGAGTHPIRVPLMVVAACGALLVTVSPPVAGTTEALVVADEATVTRGESVDIDVLANDQIDLPDPLDPVAIAITTLPDVGTAEVIVAGEPPEPAASGAADPAQPEATAAPATEVGGAEAPAAEVVAATAMSPIIRYTPGVDAPVGPVTFGYAVQVGGAEVGSATVTASIANAAPVAVADVVTVTSAPGDTREIVVLANDEDPDGGVLSVATVTDPEHGQVSRDGDVVTYDPVDDYVGDDRFSYRIVDGQGGSAEGTVEVTVADATGPMVLRDNAVKAVAGTKRRIYVLGNDDSGGRGPLEVVSVGTASAGAEVWVHADGVSVVFRARKSYVGPDSFTYRVRDRRGNRARASVAVQVVAPPPSIHITVSGPLTRKAVPYSYRPGCPVPPSQLRRIRMNYWSFSGEIRRGTLIVRSDAVSDLSYVFKRAFDAKFRIKKVRKIDYFYRDGRRSPTGSDRAAMRAGNTSAFNCRSVVGNPTKRSAHSYGIAIDINTFQNPYVVGSTFYPEGSGSYLRRVPCRRGMICRGGAVAKAMQARGWPWGARWSNPDYQHFSATGG